MLDLAAATPAQFSPYVGQVFELATPAAPVALTLTGVRALGHIRPGMREPFALDFTGAASLRLPQQIHHLENATLGAMEIFLVQVGADATGSQFEAIFN